jgi:hypothetical protein
MVSRLRRQLLHQFPTNAGVSAFIQVAVIENWALVGISIERASTMATVSRFSRREVDKALAKVRTACLKLPDTSER